MLTINDKKERAEQLFLLLLLLIPCLFIRLRFDSDTYWLINSGRYVLSHGIPTVEPFTLHENLRFVMQQWLSATAFAFVYDTLGGAALFALVAVVYVALIFSVFRLCMRVSGDNFLISFTVAFAVSIPLNFFMVPRPYLFSILLLSLELNALETFAQTQKGKTLLWLPLLSALLVNLHAAMWPMFFVLLLPFFADSFRFRFVSVHGEGFAQKPLLLALAASILAGFVNPYGWSAMTYLFRSYGNEYTASMVNEMQSPDFKSLFGIIVFVVYLATILVYCIDRKGGSKLRYVLLTIGTGFLGLSSVRSLSLFFDCGIPFVAYALRDRQIDLSSHLKNGRSLLLRGLLIGLIVAVLGGFFFFRAARSEQDSQQNLPVGAVNYIKDYLDPAAIRLYTGYDTGGYAEFEGLRPFLDARAEVFFRSNNGVRDILDDYFDVQTGKTHYSELVKRYNLTHFLVSKDDILAAYLPYDANYKLLYHDANYSVFARKESSATDGGGETR